MEGGVAMRVAGKITGVTMNVAGKIAGVVNGRFRGGFLAVPLPENLTSAACMDKTSHPVAGIFSSSDPQIDATVPPTVTIPWFESGDSELADELVGDVGEPMPRLVFSGAPTLEEAKDATFELRSALDESAACKDKTSHPVAGIFSSSDPQIDATVPPTVTTPCFESGDSELADEVVGDVGEPMPRLVFGGAPTLEEAKDATFVLRSALDEAYLSNKSSGGPYVSDPEHDKLAVSKSGHLETKACVTSDTKASAPKHAIWAFQLLRKIATRNVVASIANDQNFRAAVMQNKAFIEFLNSQKIGMNGSLKELTAGAEVSGYQSPKYFDDVMFDEENERKNGFNNLFQNIKVKLEKLMSSLSGFFRNLFGGRGSIDGNAKETLMDKAIMGSSIMGLAVMVTVAVLRRV